jgi:undecaprenyl pyrophosphate phosphatase UppP
MEQMDNNQSNNNENTRGGETAISRDNSTIFIVLGWISAVLSLLFFPFIFGVVGVVMGILATKKNSRVGLWLIVASIIFMSVGLIYSSVIMNYIRHHLGL